MADGYAWECCLVVKDNEHGIHEHYGHGDTPNRAREASLNEAAEFALENEYTFTILEERYA